MKNTLTYYAQRGQMAAKEELWKRSQWIIKGVSSQYYSKYKFIFTWDELLCFSELIFYQCLMEYSFNKNANFFTYLKQYVNFRLSSETRKHFTNKAIANTFATRIDYSEYVGKILYDKRKSLENIAFDKDTYQKLLSQLNNKEQEIIDLWANGFSMKEIAFQFDKNYKSISNLISRIISKLRNKNL